MKTQLSRRHFIQKTLLTGVGLSLLDPSSLLAFSKKSGLRFGFVTYQWGKDWDLPTLLANCEATGLLGVELRTQHAHGVETSLNATQRAEVKKRFADSPVTCVGYGSNYEFHSPDAAKLRENIEQAKAYIKLCSDIGATGIKVKPNTFPAEVPREKSIVQIATSLDELGRFAQDYGQLIRVEIHGPITSEIPNIKAIFDHVTEPNVKLCWNSNPIDMKAPGVEAHFNMVKQWIGDTTHIRGFNVDDYPYDRLFDLMKGIQYDGWVLLEAAHQVPDRVAAMKEQRKIFDQLVG